MEVVEAAVQVMVVVAMEAVVTGAGVTVVTVVAGTGVISLPNTCR